MATTTQRVTAEELLAMSLDGPCELIAGEIVMMTPAGYEHGTVAGKIFGLLWSHVVKSKLVLGYCSIDG